VAEAEAQRAGLAKRVMSSLNLGGSNTQSVPPYQMHGLGAQPSSRASPLPAGTDDYRSWLMQRSTKQVTCRGRPDAIDVSATSVQLQLNVPASPASMTSPVSVNGFLGAVFGGPSSGTNTPTTPMTPRLPPRHKAHNNVYRSPRPRPVSGPSVPPLGRTRSPLPGPELDSSVQPTDLSQISRRRMTRAARPSSSSGPPRGPGDGIDSEVSSSASGEDFGENCRQSAKWGLTEGFGDQCRGVLGPLGMLMLLLVIVFTTHQHHLKLNRLYRYK
jgi:hypothetical protein